MSVRRGQTVQTAIAYFRPIRRSSHFVTPAGGSHEILRKQFVGNLGRLATESRVLRICLLGDVEIWRDGERLTLPQSKKTRALLAYLAMTGRAHRRERLCELLWEIPDDPRGALRWSLSRLRALVDAPARRRIVATRETVAFDAGGAEIDAIAVRERMTDMARTPSTAPLQDLAGMFRGEFLEGTELPHLHDFQSWCLAEREDLRRLHARILSMLIGRLAETPEAALPHARRLAQVDPFDEPARVALLQLLLRLGRRDEAEQQFAAAVHLFKELGGDAEAGLLRTWRALRSRPRSAGAPEAAVPDLAATQSGAPSLLAAAEPGPVATHAAPLIGRDLEWRRLVSVLDTARSGNRVVLITGDPGLGKSRLLGDLAGLARGRGMRTLLGHCYEVERHRPYALWIDALGHAAWSGIVAGIDATAGEADAEPSSPGGARDRLFAAVARSVVDRASAGNPLLLVLDDTQWCDEASAALLHHLVRTCRADPVSVVLSARGGELGDNPALLGVIRSLRHDRLIEDIRLAPLPAAEAERLVRAVAARADAERIARRSGGNPLFAVELARNAGDGSEDLPRSLRELVRDRLDRLPASAAEALRWASVLGTCFAVDRLARLVPFDTDALMPVLELLERHALLEAASLDSRGTYDFTHDLVQQSVYTGISEPRRRLMHLKIARSLQDLGDDEASAEDIVHHAARAGDAGLAAAACVRAARRAARLCARGEAEAMARRGLRHAEALPEPERVQRMLELLQVETLVRRPADLAQTVARIEQLAERALDHGCREHARLGFHLLSYLRWERGRWSDAQRDTLRAELLSRTSDEPQRVVAMAEAARCLAMLERDLDQAEALVLEAGALAERLGLEPSAAADALGLLRLHQGELDTAAMLFRRARDAARRDGDRVAEFLALEHLVALEITRRRYAEAERLCGELTSLGEKLRDGSEAPFARALAALCSMAREAPDARTDLEPALAALRNADAKHRLAFALICAAQLDLEHGRLDHAWVRADEALRLATILERASEIVLARCALACVAAVRGDAAGWQHHVTALHDGLAKEVSHHARATAVAVLHEQACEGAEPRAPRGQARARATARRAGT
jgi:DNA-binding SARP family transcriptional activator